MARRWLDLEESWIPARKISSERDSHGLAVISKSCTLLSSATAADEGGSYPSHRLVMIRYGQRASTRYCTITYDGYRPDIRGLVIIRDHSLSNSFHSPVSVLTKRSVHSHAQGLLSAGAGRMNEHSNNNVSPARTEPQLRDGCQ